MKIKELGFGTEKVMSLRYYVQRELDGSDYELGAVETADATATNAIKCIARLLDYMAEKHFITAKDLLWIVNSIEISDTKDVLEFIYPEVISGRNTKQGETP